MTNRIDLFDRRKHPRFVAREGMVAVPRSSAARIGRIIDISSSGVAIHHANEGDWLFGASHIDILSIDSDFYISKIPVKVISTGEMIKKNAHGFSKEKRWSLQFGNLSDCQIAKIQNIIYNGTFGVEISC